MESVRQTRVRRDDMIFASPRSVLLGNDEWRGLPTGGASSGGKGSGDSTCSFAAENQGVKAWLQVLNQDAARTTASAFFTAATNPTNGDTRSNASHPPHEAFESHPTLELALQSLFASAGNPLSDNTSDTDMRSTLDTATLDAAALFCLPSERLSWGADSGNWRMFKALSSGPVHTAPPGAIPTSDRLSLAPEPGGGPAPTTVAATEPASSASAPRVRLRAALQATSSIEAPPASKLRRGTRPDHTENVAPEDVANVPMANVPTDLDVPALPAFSIPPPKQHQHQQQNQQQQQQQQGIQQQQQQQQQKNQQQHQKQQPQQEQQQCTVAQIGGLTAMRDTDGDDSDEDNGLTYQQELLRLQANGKILTQSDKTTLRRERNKAAARRCRLRKQDIGNQAEAKLKQLLAETQELRHNTTRTLALLRKHVLALCALDRVCAANGPNSDAMRELLLTSCRAASLGKEDILQGCTMTGVAPPATVLPTLLPMLGDAAAAEGLPAASPFDAGITDDDYANVHGRNAAYVRRAALVAGQTVTTGHNAVPERSSVHGSAAATAANQF